MDLLCDIGNVHADRINQSFRQRLVLALRNGVLLIIVALIAIIALVVFAIVLLVELALFVVVSAETIVALSFSLVAPAIVVVFIFIHVVTRMPFVGSIH